MGRSREEAGAKNSSEQERMVEEREEDVRFVWDVKGGVVRDWGSGEVIEEGRSLERGLGRVDVEGVGGWEERVRGWGREGSRF